MRGWQNKMKTHWQPDPDQAAITLIRHVRGKPVAYGSKTLDKHSLVES